MSIYKFICKKGFEGKYTIVRDYANTFKGEQIKKATIRVQTHPGLAAQVDWKEDMVLHDKLGKAYKFNIFLIVLHYSKMKYITLTWDRKQDTLFQCLTDSFEYFEGIPEEIWFDNMKTVVDQAKTQFKKVIFNTRFYGFSKDAGFRPIACRSFRPQTKGSVESLAKFVERLKPYNYEFYDDVELISLINDLRHEFNYEEISQATNYRPVDLWKTKEKEHLRPLNTELLTPYFEDDIARIVTKESMINFRKCKYSVPVKYIGCKVEIEIDTKNDNLHIYYNGEEIKNHAITEFPLNYDRDDMYEILKSDLMKHNDDEDVYEFIEETLENYDKL
jgi:transposase